MSRMDTIRAETWDEMNARHQRERDEMLARMTRQAYQRGRTAAGLPDAETLSGLLASVAAKHGLRVSQIRERDRCKKRVAARHEFFGRAARAGYSSSQIGRFAGGYDHTTVLNGIKRWEAKQ